jgi:hypothetical protein
LIEVISSRDYLLAKGINSSEAIIIMRDGLFLVRVGLPSFLLGFSGSKQMKKTKKGWEKTITRKAKSFPSMSL